MRPQWTVIDDMAEANGRGKMLSSGARAAQISQSTHP